jgi:hypothetical protein
MLGLNRLDTGVPDDGEYARPELPGRWASCQKRGLVAERRRRSSFINVAQDMSRRMVIPIESMEDAFCAQFFQLNGVFQASGTCRRR